MIQTPDQLEERFNTLTFEIMFHKYLYFEYERPQISDSLYDSLKEEYHRIGEQLGFQLTKFAPCHHYSHGHPLAPKVAASAKQFLGFYD